MKVTQAGRVLFIVPLRYLFAIGLQYIMDEHHYLAFDVSLPPLNNLSCSPKQLDSDKLTYESTSNPHVRAKRDCHTLWCKKKTHSNEKLDFQHKQNVKESNEEKES